MLKMVDGTGIIGVDMVCPLGATVSPPQPPNYDNIEMEGVGSLMLPNSLKAPLERLESIGNSTQSENPAPDNPQEIKSAGRKSKNLFDINYFKNKNNLQTIQCEGFALLGITCNVKPNTNYTLSARLAEVKYNLNIANKGTRFSLTSSPARTLMSNDDGTLCIGFYGVTADKVNMDDFMKQYKNIQLEEGNVASDYDPYGYLLDLKVTGKNLLSNKPADWQIGKRISWSGYPEGAITIYPVIKNAVNVISLKPSTSYSIINNSGGIVINRIVERGSSENGIKDHAVRSSKYTFVTNQNAMNAILQLKKVDGTELLSSDIESIKIMLVEGEVNEPTPYELYTEQTVQIALNEPLRGIGEYKDTITKDGIVRKIKRIVLDGSEDEEWRLDRKLENHINFALAIKGAITVNTGIRTMMDKFKYFGAIWNSDILGQDMFGATLRINMPKTLATDLQTFKTWLSQNPLTVDYVLAEPVTELLPESVQAQLSSLHSENGVTHVFVDSGEVPCGIKLTYRKEI